MSLFQGTSNFAAKRAARHGKVNNRGILKDEKKQNNNNDNNVTSQVENQRNKKPSKRNKRHISHPVVMSYPIAVTPDEANGTRLLIKCFEYRPQTTSFSTAYTPLVAPEGGGIFEGRNYLGGEYLKNKEGNIRLAPTNLQFDNRGSSDQYNKTQQSHHYYVELPIPQDVNDSNTVTWGDDSMNVFQLAGLQAASEFMKSPVDSFENLKEAFTVAATEGMGLSEDLKNAVAAGIAGKAIDPQGNNISANSAISRSTGQILNSNLELLFNNVNLRSFPMNVTFSPRNYDESMMVKHIIRAFKSSMAAKKGRKDDGAPVGGSGGIFLKSPDVFSIRYLHNGKDHPFLNSFKHCALTGMSVNYTNAGTFASYADGTPVSIQMSLTFKELNPIYHEDYDDLDSGDFNGVGF